MCECAVESGGHFFCGLLVGVRHQRVAEPFAVVPCLDARAQALAERIIGAGLSAAALWANGDGCATVSGRLGRIRKPENHRNLTG